MKKEAGALSTALEATFVVAVANNDRLLQEGAGKSGLTAWYAVAGRIPIFWTEKAVKAGIKKKDYENG